MRIDHDLYAFEKSKPNYKSGGLYSVNGKATTNIARVRSSYEKLHKGDVIVNDNTKTYVFRLYKYNEPNTSIGSYIDSVVVKDGSYEITEEKYYRIMGAKISKDAFTSEEIERFGDIIYFNKKKSRIDDKADRTDADHKAPFPTSDRHEALGGPLPTNGTTTWVHPAQPAPAIIGDPIADWMKKHPESTMGSINPLSFGAAGNGLTDDTEAIQNAINYAVTNGIAVVDGIGKTYVVSGAVHGPASEVHDLRLNYGMYLHGNLVFRNFKLKLKDETDTQLTSVLNVYNNTDEIIIIENVTIDGNIANQNSVPAGKGQDGGFHGIRVGFTHDCGVVIINNCDIQNCYTDGICTRPKNYTMVQIKNCIIKGNGRNGITDNALSSCVENCMIEGNGVRTAPRSGYHIEPDSSRNFGIKKLVNCKIENNRSNDFVVCFKSRVYNLDLLEIDSCEIGAISWGNHGITDDCLHKNIRIYGSVIGTIKYGNGNTEDALNQFGVFDISNTRVLKRIAVRGGRAYQSGVLSLNSVSVDGPVDVTMIKKLVIIGCRFAGSTYSLKVRSGIDNVVFANNTIDCSGDSTAVNFGDCNGVVCIGNISGSSENSTFDTSSVTTVQKANNIFRS